jgi:CheY-like chemotaxis protein
MDGPEAVQALRAYPEMAKTPILALTGSTDPEDLELAERAGYNDWVNKGSGHVAVLEKVRHWLSVRI